MTDGPQIAAAALAQGSVLSGLGEGERLRLVAAGSAIELAAGATLFRQGDAGDAAFVLLSGELEVRTQAGDGREVRISGLGPGALVGEMAVFDGEVRSAEITAARRSRLWRIPRLALIETVRADPQVGLAIAADLSRRLRAANIALEASQVQPLGERLASLLLGERNARGAVALTQTEMARRLGFSREKVNRKLHDWALVGWIEVDRAGVRLLRPESLPGRRAD